MLGRIEDTSESHERDDSSIPNRSDVSRSEAEDWLRSKHQEVIWFHVCRRADDYCIDGWPLATHMNRDELKFYIRFECKITFHSNPAQNIAESFTVCVRKCESNPTIVIVTGILHESYGSEKKKKKKQENIVADVDNGHTKRGYTDTLTAHRVYSNVLMLNTINTESEERIERKYEKITKTEIKVNIDDV